MSNNLTKIIDSSNYDICPYCSDQMVIAFTDDKTYRSTYTNGYKYSPIHPSIYFYCRCCKARSPMIELNNSHIDTRAVKESMSEYINGLDGEDEA